MKNKKSLRTILSVYYLLAASIPFILFASLVYLYTLGQFKDSIEDRNISSANLIVSAVEKSMDNIQNSLLRVATVVDGRVMNQGEVEILLQSIVMTSTEISEVRLLDDEGVVYALAPYSDALMGLDMSNYPSFRNALQSHEVYWAPSIISESQRTPVFQISLPMKKGVLIADVVFTDLNRMLNELNVGRNSVLAITDQTGTYIAHTDITNVLERNEDPYFTRFSNETPDGSVKMVRIDDSKQHDTAYTALIGPSKWLAVIYQDSEDSFQGLVSYTIAFVSLAFLILFLGMLFLQFRFRRFTSHFNELVSFATSISRGEYQHSMQEKDIKEFNDIVAALSKMSASIKFREEEINKLNSDLEQKLKEITALHNINENVMSSAAESIWGLDIEGHIVFINKAACKMLGYSKDELIDRNHHDLCHYQREDGSPYPIEECPIHSSLHDGIPRRGTDAFVKKDGAVIPVDYYSMPIFDDGMLKGIVVSALDISERLQSELEMLQLRKLLGNIIDSMPSVLIAVDQQGTVLLWNARAERETGLRADEVLGRELKDVYPKINSKISNIHETIVKSRTQSEERLTVQRGNRTFYENLTIFPIVDDDLSGAVIRVDDVTDRVYLEQMMIQSEKMMSLGGLAAGMAHEINNPLAGIAGCVHNIDNRIFGDLKANDKVAMEANVDLESIRDYLRRRDIPKMLNIIREASDRASAIVRNMLSFSRKSEKLIEQYRIADLLDKTVKLAENDFDLKKEFDFRKIKIQREYAQDLPKVRCEGNEIQQVFLNVLKNGAEAMKEKQYCEEEPCFVLKMFREGQYITTVIEDNGPGIAAEALSRIFEPFFTTKAVGKGTGLGLSVSYFIVTEQHSGKMNIESEPGEWTRFTIKLPIERSV